MFKIEFFVQERVFCLFERELFVQETEQRME